MKLSKDKVKLICDICSYGGIALSLIGVFFGNQLQEMQLKEAVTDTIAELFVGDEENDVVDERN